MTKPQSVLCNAVLSVEAMKPSKLKRHPNTKHPEHVEKDLSFFESKELTLKRQKLDSKGYFQQQNKALVEPFYEAALAIVKQTKPNSIGETLVKPCAVTMVKVIFGEPAESDIWRIEEIKASPLFAFQVDESTNVALCSQLVVFVRYIHEYDIKKEFYFALL